MITHEELAEIREQMDKYSYHVEIDKRVTIKQLLDEITRLNELLSEALHIIKHTTLAGPLIYESQFEIKKHRDEFLEKLEAK